MLEPLKRGIQPFWFWNGEMDDEEIRRQVGEMSEQGLRGFLIHPRQGMEVPYLSEMYFEKVRTAVEAAKEHQMEVWLYDEFPYPSGISGGKVTLEHPEYACLELTKTCQVCHGGETARVYGPWGRVVMARAYRMEEGRCRWDEFIDLKDFVGSGYVQDVFQMSGLTKYNKKRYFQGELSQFLCWNVPEGDWKIYLYTEVVMKHFKYFENFIDPLNPDAVKCFLETTHEKYRQYIGDEFGKTVRGVFTDEVTAFPPFHPWSALLPGLVRRQSGLELTEYLPALTEDMGEITGRVRYAYWNAATEQFIESWDKQVYHWCEQNHLLYIGEKPILRSKELAYVHVPGIDAGHQKFGSRAALAEGIYRANGKIVSSAAHFYKKPAALCEAFHSIGWGMTIQDAKWIFDWLTVMGIDWFITHGAYYTTDGLKKHDAPPSSFYQMPWWRDVHELTGYVERLGGMLTEGTRHVSVLLLDPITSTWTETGRRLAVLNEKFAQFQNELLRGGVDYYIMDPQLFAEGTVREDEDGAWYENCGDSYKLVVLPFMTNLEAGAVRKLEEYAQKGGVLLAVGTLPYENLEGYEYGEWTARQFQKDPSEVREQFFRRYAAEEHGSTDGLGDAGVLFESGDADACLEQAEWNGNCYFSMDYHGAARELCRLERSMRVWKVRMPQGGDILQIQCRGKDSQERLFLVNLDAETNSQNQVIGTRSFGTNPNVVSSMALSVARGLNSHGVLAVYKHFPGHGATVGDTHEGFAYTEKTLEELMQSELVPFKSAADNGIDMIMAAHISVPNVTGDNVPCSLSYKMITGVLKEQLGYNGLIVTDALNMGAIAKNYSSEDAAVMAVMAGDDLLLMPKDFKAAAAAVINQVKSGNISEERINQSVRKIVKAKLQL